MSLSSAPTLKMQTRMHYTTLPAVSLPSSVPSYHPLRLHVVKSLPTDNDDRIMAYHTIYLHKKF